MKAKPKAIRGLNGISMIVILLILLSLSCLSLNIPGTKSSSDFPDDPNIDRSFITGQPCEAPCWYGLTLGVSTTSDIRNTLHELSLVDQSTLFEYSYEINEMVFGFDCVYYHVPGGGGCGVLQTSPDGKLKSMVISVQYPLTLKSAIDRLGIPKYYTVDTSSTEDNCILSIYWPEKSIVVVTEENSRKKHCSENKSAPIDLDLQIVSLIYTRIDPQDQQNYETRPWPDSAP